MAGGLLLSLLSACSTIKSWFPDKERDYQFTAEIPELIIPEELKNKGMRSLNSNSERNPAKESVVAEAQNPGPVESSQQTEIVKESTQETTTGSGEREPDSVTPQLESSASSLQIDQALNSATRMVSRALSRQKIEVVERNIDKGFFYVKFDPNAQKASDENFWDELNFLFGDDPSQEEEYRLTVRQIKSELCEVTVQDSAGKTLSNFAANALLQAITRGINEVLMQDAEDNPAAVPESKSEPATKVEEPSASKAQTVPQPEPSLPQH